MVEVIGCMMSAFCRQDTKFTLIAAAPRCLDQVDQRVNVVSGKKRIIELVRSYPSLRRSINSLMTAVFIILEELKHIFNPAGTDDIEKSGSKFREERADGSSGDDQGSPAAEVIGELPHSIQICLQTTEEYQLVITLLTSVVWTVKILVVQGQLISVLINERADMQSVYRLKDIHRAAFAAIAAQVGCDDHHASFMHKSHYSTVRVEKEPDSQQLRYLPYTND